MRLTKEKLIGIGGENFPKFNQIVFLAGGAGSGKGYILHNLLGIEGKILDVDEISGKISKILSKQIDPKKYHGGEFATFLDRFRKWLRDPKTKAKLAEDQEDFDPDIVGKVELKDYYASIEKRISDIEDGNTFMSTEYDPRKTGDFFNPKNPRDVSLRYWFQKSIKKPLIMPNSGSKVVDKDLPIDDHTLANMVINSQEGRRPNIIIDTTLSSPKKIKDTIDLLNEVLEKVGKSKVDPKDVSLVWALTPLTIATQQNASRERSVGMNQMISTHRNSTQTMKSLLGGEAESLYQISSYLDGDVIVVCNNGKKLKITKDAPFEYRDDDTSVLYYGPKKRKSNDKEDDDYHVWKAKPNIGYIDEYCAFYAKHRGTPFIPLKELPEQPLFGGKLDNGEVIKVGNLLDAYTMPALLSIDPNEPDADIDLTSVKPFTQENRKMNILEAKARTYQKVKQALSGKNDLIKTWGIITAENPMAHSFSDEENAKRDKALRQHLAKSNLEYLKVKGQYGNPENSLFLINPSLRDMTEIATKFGQESFIFATNSNDGDFSFDAGYYETEAPAAEKKKFADPEYVGDQNHSYKYNKSITKNNIIDQKDADDFFTSIKAQGRKFKFQIPFFESTIRRAYERMTLCTEGKDPDNVQYDLMRTTLEADNYSASGRWRIRGLLYHQD